ASVCFEFELVRRAQRVALDCIVMVHAELVDYHHDTTRYMNLEFGADVGYCQVWVCVLDKAEVLRLLEGCYVDISFNVIGFDDMIDVTPLPTTRPLPLDGPGPLPCVNCAIWCSAWIRPYQCLA